MHRDRLLYVIVFAILIWCLFISSSLSDVRKQHSSDEPVVTEYYVSGFSTDLTSVISKAKSSIVRISGPSGSAVGFVYRQDGNDVYVIGNYYETSAGIRVYYDSMIGSDAEIAGYDDKNGIVLLKLNSVFTVPALRNSDSSKLKTGEFVIGVSDDGSLSSQYILSSISHDEMVLSEGLNIRLSNEMKKGTIVLNMNGDLVGMVREDGSFLTGNELMIIADGMLSGDRSSKLDLGVRGIFVSKMENYLKSGLGIDMDMFDGLYVESVRQGSFASYCGIEQGDIILSINGSELNDSNALLDMLYSSVAEYEFSIYRNHDTMTLRSRVE